ncbi:MAG: hypothetical protein JO244_06225 [Solirubrobacterales bacterium]|nr:hypothetical protein [Solirubrobacterales bacterium]
MTHRKMLGLLAASAPCVLAATAAFAFAPAAALGAGPSTNCGGSLKRAPTSLDPNALNYSFNCNWGITAYSIIATRQPSDYSTIDDFGPDGLAYDGSGNPVTGVGFDCAGQVPGNGINCGLSSGYLPAPDYAEGWIDTSVPYCSYISQGSTRAVPQAIVQVIVTDTNGVEDGPFRLNLPHSCPPVRPPAKKAKAGRSKAKSAQDNSHAKSANGHAKSAQGQTRSARGASQRS